MQRNVHLDLPGQFVNICTARVVSGQFRLFERSQIAQFDSFQEIEGT